MAFDFPFRWPSEWVVPDSLGLLKDTPVDCLVVGSERPAGLEQQARSAGLEVALEAEPLSAVHLIRGEWPGVRMGQGHDSASAGPTGAPWVDSNGWQVLLARMLHPEKKIWVAAELPKQSSVIHTEAYLVAIADAQVYGGSWVVALDEHLRQQIAVGSADALAEWRRIADAMRFFAGRPRRPEWRPVAVLGILSDFSGPNEFLSGELLNLTARLHQPYRILEKGKVAGTEWADLKEIVYLDGEPPAAGLRRALLDFVEKGGLLLTNSKWGSEDGMPAADQHPRYALRTVGRGRIAIATEAEPDAFLLASDAQVLLSHRHDLVRFWNGGALGSYYTAAPGGRQALIQIVNYAGRPGHDPVSLRVAGKYGRTRWQSLQERRPRELQLIPKPGAVEMHVPPVAVYGAIELEA